MSAIDACGSQVNSKHTVKRLEQLRGLLDKNRSAYYRAIDSGRDLSKRLYGCIDEYNRARHQPAWYEFCAKHGLATSHTALDNLA